jgi:hypothetical protein
MKNSATLGNRLAYGLLLLMTLCALAARGQQLKLDIHVFDDSGDYQMTNIQVKEVDTVTGSEVLRTFTTKKGKLIIPLELGKKYVLHFWAPNKEFRSVIVDCTNCVDLTKNYWFGFDITLPDEQPQYATAPVKDLVAMIWISYNTVQYQHL